MNDTEHLLSSAENAKRLRESIAEFKQTKPTVYLSIVDSAIEISAYPYEHKDAGSYGMALREFQPSRGFIKSEFSINTLRNILERAGVTVVIE